MASLHILESSIDLFYIIADSEGLILTSNDLFKEYSSHVKPKNILDIASNDSDRDDFLATINRSKSRSPDPQRVYVRSKQKIGSERYNMWNVYYILDSLHFIGIPCVDVTSITAHEHERQKVLIEEFRFMISHELRQPLTSIGGLVDMLMEHKEATDNERAAIMEMIADSVKRLDESIRLLVKKLTRQI